MVRYVHRRDCVCSLASALIYPPIGCNVTSRPVREPWRNSREAVAMGVGVARGGGVNGRSWVKVKHLSSHLITCHNLLRDPLRWTASWDKSTKTFSAKLAKRCSGLNGHGTYQWKEIFKHLLMFMRSWVTCNYVRGRGMKDFDFDFYWNKRLSKETFTSQTFTIVISIIRSPWALICHTTLWYVNWCDCPALNIGKCRYTVRNIISDLHVRNAI